MRITSPSFGRHATIARRAIVALACAATLIPVAAANHSPERGERDTVWVANRDAGTIMVFDAATGEAVTASPLLVGPGLHDIAVSQRTGKVFVSDDVSKIYVLSAETQELLDTLQFATGSRPHHMSVSHDQKTVYVGLFASNTIAAIDTRSHGVRLMASSAQAGTTAHAPEPSPDDRLVFVPHEGQNLVTKLSASTGALLGSAILGSTPNSSPSEVLATRDGETLLVSMRNEGVIRAIDIDTFTPVGAPVAVGVQPESLILTPGERTLVVSLRGSPARVAFVDTDTMTFEQTIDIAGPGTFGDLAVASPNLRYVYATFDAGSAGTGGVAKIDLHTRAVVDTLTYPTTGRTHGIAYVRHRARH